MIGTIVRNVVRPPRDQLDAFVPLGVATVHEAMGRRGLMASRLRPIYPGAAIAGGTVKETLGTVNLPIVCAGQLVHPGDVIVADDDGVLVVPRQEIESALAASPARVEKESAMRVRLAAGEFSTDLAGLRERFVQKGLRFVDNASEIHGKKG